MNPVKPMLPTLAEKLPRGNEWVYECKYDGYRCLVYWDKNGLELFSRNGNALTAKFPEIAELLISRSALAEPALPVWLDGEICILASKFKAVFSEIQTRGRLSNKETIRRGAAGQPAVLAIFDIMSSAGTLLHDRTYTERRRYLRKFMEMSCFPEEVTGESPSVCLVQSYGSGTELKNLIEAEKGEGIVAKRKTSRWVEGKRSADWVKWKNWRTALFFVAGKDKRTGYFYAGLHKKGEIKIAGKFSAGLSSDERSALSGIIHSNIEKETKTAIWVKPAICIDLQYLEWAQSALRQPRFVRFRFDASWEECEWETIAERS
ncbi:non-homologous end-joining DNA ligase [Bacillus marinisedimentorum]|uniref:non-homologous end-joining DNA ligase n=1 Tax=Bacillus marinisedimentorum TaxID=1821260 RepID=UPI0009F41B3D|nr:non-homologous end-joining DNA ligase [Bacillus marinisedimentorum]